MKSKIYNDSQEKLVDRFVIKFSELIESSNQKTEIKIERLEDTTSDHKKKIASLEEMADEFDQMKGNNNIIVRALKPNENTKASVSQTVDALLKSPTAREIVEGKVLLKWILLLKFCVREQNVALFCKITAIQQTKYVMELMLNFRRECLSSPKC